MKNSNYLLLLILFFLICVLISENEINKLAYLICQIITFVGFIIVKQIEEK